MYAISHWIRYAQTCGCIAGTSFGRCSSLDMQVWHVLPYAEICQFSFHLWIPPLILPFQIARVLLYDQIFVGTDLAGGLNSEVTK